MIGRPEIRASTVAVMFLVLCMALFVATFTFFFASIAEQTKSQLEDRATAAAQVLASNTHWVNQLAIQTLRRVDSAIGADFNEKRTEDLAAAIDGRPAQFGVYIIDAEGLISFATDSNLIGVDVSDRQYFTSIRDGDAFYTTERLVDRVTEQSFFGFGKRVTRNNRFAGVILATFKDDLLQGFARTVDYAGDASIGLIRRDGQLMGFYPPIDATDLSSNELFTQHLSRSDDGSYFTDHGFVEDVPKVVAYKSIVGTDIVAVAFIPSKLAWFQYRDQIISLFVIVMPVFAALLIVGIWIWRLLARDAVRRAALEEANETNVLLFREIHHRVKNNLQSVQSLVRLQDMPQSAKVDLQSRLGAMAAMHEHIYRNDKYEDINANELIPVVVAEVVRAYGAHVQIIYDLDHAAVDRDHLTPLSLLLSELVTNALKYAFTDDTGVIQIILRDHQNGRCTLLVIDNGVGIAENNVDVTSMGLRLIRGVVAQMGGVCRFSRANGTRFEADLALKASGHQAETHELT